MLLLSAQDHHGKAFGANYSVITSKLSAGYEVALGVHISVDKIPNVIQIAKLWAGPVICAILSEPSVDIVQQFKLQAPNVDPVFVPPASNGDHLYVAVCCSSRFLVLCSTFALFLPMLTSADLGIL